VFALLINLEFVWGWGAFFAIFFARTRGRFDIFYAWR